MTATESLFFGTINDFRNKIGQVQTSGSCCLRDLGRVCYVLVPTSGVFAEEARRKF